MAAGGEYLPREVLSIIFPVAYWDLIQKHAAANGLDPYFVAALVAQESTFVPDILSSARAVGLMQLMPPTARAYARKLGMTYSPRLLTNPEANIRMGTAYLADKVREFGDLHLVLASYNAGERPVRRWLADRPGVPVDQFIDDIPYPETQNYVKRILGTAEDYRRLYSGRKLAPLAIDAVADATDTDAVASADRSDADNASPVAPAAAASPAKRAAAKKPAVSPKAVAKKRTTKKL
jgi:soluble lytic murein transglycosylase